MGSAISLSSDPLMTIQFPNDSRYYDAALHAVRFWGHDGAMEAPFFVDEDALKQLQPGADIDEAGLLNAFDLTRADSRDGRPGLRPRPQGLVRPAARRLLKRHPVQARNQSRIAPFSSRG